MPQSAAPASGVSLVMIEGTLTLIAVGLAFAFPRLGRLVYQNRNCSWKACAPEDAGGFCRGSLCAPGATRAAAMVSDSAAVLPDDFSFLLAADTFAHGRLTNPTPADVDSLRIHSHLHAAHLHVDVFSGQGLILAFGQGLSGTSLVRTAHRECVDVRRAVLDAAGVAAARLGAAGRGDCRDPAFAVQLLDQ